MVRLILISFFLLSQFHAHAQFSASAGYRYSLDGVNFRQNHFNFYAQWKQPKRFHFSAGIEITPNRMDYLSKEVDFDYDHGPPGYSYSETHTYSRKAKVSYIYVSGGLFFDWAIIEGIRFDLLFGFFGQFGSTIFKKEKGHQTNGAHSYGSEWAGEYSSSSTTDPVSYSEFAAIEMAFGNASVGLKLSPRWYFNQNYLQLDLSAGRTAQRIFRDLQGSDCYFHDNDNCFEYPYLFRKDKPFYVSFGFTIGHSF